MTHERPPTGELETPIGPVRFIVTQGDHVYLEQSRRDVIVVNGVAYNLSLHLYRLEDGSWGTGPRRETFYMSRQDSSQEPSRAAYKKAFTVLVEVWSVFARQNPEIFRQAEIHHLVEGIEHLDEKIRKAMQEAESMGHERLRLLSAAKQLGYHGPMKQDWAP